MSWSIDDLPWPIRWPIYFLMYWKWIVAALLVIGTGCWFFL